jgi:hypothetical protein
MDADAVEATSVSGMKEFPPSGAAAVDGPDAGRPDQFLAATNSGWRSAGLMLRCRWR